MSRLARFALALAVAAAACGGAPGSETIVVSAASSLSDVFTAIGAAFEDANPETEVVFNFAASSTLREQVAGGAPVDVLASASRADVVPIADLLGEPSTFAINGLAIAVPSGNPAALTGLSDFEREDLVLGVCVPIAPCGALAVEAFARAGVDASIDTEEPNVRAVLTKVAAGELDAGIVYMTDIGSGVDGIDITESPVTEYPIAVVLDGPNPSQAAAFVDFVRSDEGAAILAEYGFGSP